MAYNPNQHHRRSMRLRAYDYAQPGVYFVTICAHGRARMFDDPALRQSAEEQWHALNNAGLRGACAGCGRSILAAAAQPLPPAAR
jgi:hypothetical protein